MQFQILGNFVDHILATFPLDWSDMRQWTTGSITDVFATIAQGWTSFATKNLFWV